MNDTGLCHFYSAANQKGCLLLGESCTGTKSKKLCRFKKTTKEYIEGNNRAIEINRRKGNCENCKYRFVKCEPVKTGEVVR